jgi:hypothetical protein
MEAAAAGREQPREREHRANAMHDGED